ncbi:MAG TPA: DUF2911 domain-containing protein [Longimicrobiales bacterium]|nr:DUF2911 domain-containing protein [Longimicrobiales bacterium]
MTLRFRALATFGVLSLALPGTGQAQIMASERATVSQTIDGTTIAIDYARPRIRDRGEPFGDIAHIGDHRWTPGANWASMLTSNKPFKLNGHDVPEGTWSLWIDLEEDAWTMILDPTDSIFHTAPPPDSDDQIRFVVEPREGPFIDAMLFWIPEYRIDGFELRLGWGTTEIPFEVEVESTLVTMVAEAQGRPLEGTYLLTWAPPPPGEEGDPQEEENATPRAPLPFAVSWADDRLNVLSVWEGTDEPFEGMLLPMRGDWYRLGWGVDGELWEVLPGMALQVVRDEAGHAIGFDARAEDHTLLAEIRRSGPEG